VLSHFGFAEAGRAGFRSRSSPLGLADQLPPSVVNRQIQSEKK
jgi:hypothetical protein